MILRYTNKTSELKSFVFAMKQWLESENIELRIKEECHVVCEEIFTNIVSYAFPPNHSTKKEKPFILVEFIKYSNKSIAIKFTDNGTPFDIMAYYNKTSESKVISSLGGMGVKIAVQMSKSIHYRYFECKNILTLELGV